MARNQEDDMDLSAAVEAARIEAAIAKTPITANELDRLAFRLEAAEVAQEEVKRMAKAAKANVDEATYELRKGLRRLRNNEDYESEERETNLSMRMFKS